MHLKLKVEKIDYNSQTSVFINSQPTGELIAIVQVSVMDDEGKFIRSASINKALLKHLSELQIEIPTKI